MERNTIYDTVSGIEESGVHTGGKKTNLYAEQSEMEAQPDGSTSGNIELKYAPSAFSASCKRNRLFLFI